MNRLLVLLARYGVYGFFRLGRDVLLSRLLISRQLRIVRYPWYVRGARFIKFGRRFTSGVGMRIDAFGEGPDQIHIGDDVEIGDYVHIAAVRRVVLGANCLLASKVYISDHDHGSYRGADGIRPDTLQRQKPLAVADVVIGDNVWLGENVVVLKGVEIGRNSVVAASSVVTKSVPSNAVAAGNPARVIKIWNDQTGMWERPQ
jgi:lipopolysaccharide O-acetyltransferase